MDLSQQSVELVGVHRVEVVVLADQVVIVCEEDDISSKCSVMLLCLVS